MSMMNEFLEAMDEDREYDFIANNYPHMSKFDLRTILLEYMYAIHSTRRKSMYFSDDIREAVRDELQAKEVFG